MSHASPASDQARFQKRAPAQISEIEGITEDIRTWADQCAIPARTINSVILMLDELLTNVVMHGYAEDDGGEMEVSLTLNANVIEACLRDSAPAFDPFSIAEPDTTLDIDERDIGGLGVHFVRKMADSFSYRRDGDINEVRFSKNFPA
ncbi:ATP-binding protein [Undibacterium sp. TS12]|uniref:ATP-binding protein n=1 Tax=Undibacterium sp. TS12 TaxID=2908202 RepID=UPI001F4C9AD6|nr:ATP-binding protein [Undibacterium sp. TS12]MCH8621043.1 ATP-binding protein [Undibacterium sp. TS12]